MPIVKIITVLPWPGLPQGIPIYKEQQQQRHRDQGCAEGQLWPRPPFEEIRCNLVAHRTMNKLAIKVKGSKVHILSSLPNCLQFTKEIHSKFLNL